MEIVVELFMEIIFGVLVEGFLSLWFWVFPGKHITEKGKKVAKVICALISLAFLVALVVGIILLGSSQGENFWGWLLISLSVIYVISGIVLKIVFYVKK